MLTTGNQLKAARALIDMGQSELADRAKVNVNTVRNMEASGAGPIAGREQNVQAVQSVLERAGVEFLNGNKPGVRLKAQGPVDEGIRPNQLTSENDG
jgi:transcriptional regulator with XRE-family HTH domain